MGRVRGVAAGWPALLPTVGEDMKRTATTLVLLTGLGGGCVTPETKLSRMPAPATAGYGTVTQGQAVPGLQGPTGEPVMAARASVPLTLNPPAQSGGFGSTGQTMDFKKAAADTSLAAHLPGVSSASGVTPTPSVVNAAVAKPSASAVVPVNGFGPGAPPLTQNYNQAGILPVPGMGPPGAVAAVGAMPMGMPQTSNLRSSIRFANPAGMKVTWQLPGGVFNDEGSGLTTPKEYNFPQSQVYRLRLSQVANFPGKTFYPTLEVTAANPKTITYLSHSSIPITFANDDFDQAVAGNLVVKVVYLPDREFQDFAVVGGGADEVVSTRLEPGADPVAEAQLRGTILAIIRLGNIDLENRSSPAMTAPPGSGGAGMMMPLPAPKRILLPAPGSPIASPASPLSNAIDAKPAPILTAPTAPSNLPSLPVPVPAAPSADSASAKPNVLPPISK